MKDRRKTMWMYELASRLEGTNEWGPARIIYSHGKYERVIIWRRSLNPYGETEILFEIHPSIEGVEYKQLLWILLGAHVPYKLRHGIPCVQIEDLRRISLEVHTTTLK